MKKSVFSLILGASLMVSSSALALTAMTDSNMKDATGQAGVSIALDDITLYQAIGRTVYTDNDGLGAGAADAAGVFISGAETLTTIRAIFAGDTDRGGFLAHDYDDIYASNMSGAAFTSKALTIDVANTAYLMTKGKEYNVDQYIANNIGTADVNGDGNTDGLDALAEELQEKGHKKAFNLAATGQLSAYKTKLTAVIMNLAGLDEATAAGAADGVIAAATATSNGATYGAAWETAVEGAVLTATGLPLTVDALAMGIAGATSWGAYADTINDNLAVAGVVIGLPTIEIRKSGSLKHIGVTAQEGTANSGNSFIAVKKTDSTLAILDGYVEICPH